MGKHSETVVNRPGETTTTSGTGGVDDGLTPREASGRADAEIGESVERVAGALRALADPTRFRLYLTLRRGETCVCELAEELGLAENLVSHHLKALRQVGLVQTRRDPTDARWVYYQLDAETLKSLFAALGALFDPQTLGVRVPTCGPAAGPRLIVPTRGANRGRRGQTASG